MCTFLGSHLTWVRGLKPSTQYGDVAAVRSHLTWVRGLKHEPADT